MSLFYDVVFLYQDMVFLYQDAFGFMTVYINSLKWQGFQKNYAKNLYPIILTDYPEKHFFGTGIWKKNLLIYF